MLMFKWVLDGQEKQGTIDCDRSLLNSKVDEKEGEGVGDAPPSRYDYGKLLDYDPSGIISRNLLEHFVPKHIAAHQWNCYGSENLPSITS